MGSSDDDSASAAVVVIVVVVVVVVVSAVFEFTNSVSKAMVASLCNNGNRACVGCRSLLVRLVGGEARRSLLVRFVVG